MFRCLACRIRVVEWMQRHVVIYSPLPMTNDFLFDTIALNVMFVCISSAYLLHRSQCHLGAFRREQEFSTVFNTGAQQFCRSTHLPCTYARAHCDVSSIFSHSSLISQSSSPCALKHPCPLHTCMYMLMSI